MLDSHLLQIAGGVLYSSLGVIITILVMTFAEVSPGHQHPVGAFAKRAQDHGGVDAA